MSHAHATFVFEDRVLFGEYNGTSDVMLPLMFDTKKGVSDHWRKQEWKDCDCGNDPVPCAAHTDYGGGFWWIGEACLVCRVFVGPKMPFDYDVDYVDAADPPKADVLR